MWVGLIECVNTILYDANSVTDANNQMLSFVIKAKATPADVVNRDISTQESFSMLTQFKPSE